MANFYNHKFGSLQELISFGENAIETATDAQILDTFINQMKEIYGNNIDISEEVADGIWVRQLANLYSKMFGVVAKFSHMLNPEEANGKYLDICCAFSNIFRKEQSYSTCYIAVKYTGNDHMAYIDPSDPNTQYIEVIDTSGKVWKWSETKADGGNFATVFEDNTTYDSLLFQCDTPGPITLKQGADVSFIDSGIVKFVNPIVQEDALPGRNEESDIELRNRRTLEQGNASTTTLSGLEGALREIASIEDVFINNNVANVYPPSPLPDNINYDGQSISTHTVYICLRYNKQIAPNKFEIANTIYNKLTPGIGTQQYTVGTELAQGEEINGENIYWKVCQPKAENIDLKILVTKYFASFSNFSDIAGHEHEFSNATTEKIVNNIIDFIDSLGFKQTLTIGGIINAINLHSTTDLDGNIMYVATGGTFLEADGETPKDPSDYQYNNLTYFDYNKVVNKYNGTTYEGSYGVEYVFEEDPDSPISDDTESFIGYRVITIKIRKTSLS